MSRSRYRYQAELGRQFELSKYRCEVTNLSSQTVWTCAIGTHTRRPVAERPPCTPRRLDQPLPHAWCPLEYRRAAQDQARRHRPSCETSPRLARSTALCRTHANVLRRRSWRCCSTSGVTIPHPRMPSLSPRVSSAEAYKFTAPVARLDPDRTERRSSPHAAPVGVVSRCRDHLLGRAGREVGSRHRSGRPR
jgi:hypothetical protein